MPHNHKDTDKNKIIISWSSTDSTLIAHCLQLGQVVVGSSDTVFGLLAMPTQQGFDALNRIKGRQKKPYLILVGSIDQAISYVDQEKQNPEEIRALMRQCWPGPVTLLLSARPSTPAFMKSASGSIAIRYPRHDGLQRLLNIIPALFSTSANMADNPVPGSVQDLDPKIVKSCEYAVVDEHKASDCVLPSTIIDCTRKPYVIVRQGSFSQVDLDRCLREVQQKKRF